MLPPRAIKLISEYSRPITRPDWRNSKPLVSQYNIFRFAISINPKWSRLRFRVFCLISKTDWYNIFIFVKQFGLEQYYYHYGWNDILHIDGIIEAEDWFQNPGSMSW